MSKSWPSDEEVGRAAEIPTAETIRRLDRLRATEEELIRERCLHFGALMAKLAMTRHGLDDPAESASALRSLIRTLTIQLDMTRDIATMLKRSTADTEGVLKAASLAREITEFAEREGLSLRDIARRTEGRASHTTIGAVVRGEASLKMTVLVAEALGIPTQPLAAEQ